MQDWSGQIIEMQRKWVEQQQKLMNDWLESMRQAGAGAPQADWRQAADVMEQQVTSALDAQKQSLQAMISNMQSVEGAPKELGQAVKQMEDGVNRWTDVQSQMWQVWFDALRKSSPSPAPKSAGETMMDNWEDMVKQTMSIQEQWLSSWTGAADGKSAASSSKPKKPSGGGKQSKK